MEWRDRERLFYWGSALALLPAVAFLPAFVALIFHPAISHAALYAAILFPVMAAAEFLGVFKLVQSCVQRPFTLLTMLSFGALLVLLVIVAYTGIFLVVLVERM
jgi:hypothetical protein